MNRIRALCWWIFFIAGAVVLQAAFPGLDFLVVGLLILLQEKNYKNMLWLVPVCIFLQEGMGTRFFGGSILLYTATAIFFGLGQWLFEVESFLFVVLLSAVLVAPHYALDWLMAPLQNITFDVQKTMDRCLLQAMLMPFAWRAFTLTRRWIGSDESQK